MGDIEHTTEFLKRVEMLLCSLIPRFQLNKALTVMQTN